MIGMIMLMGLVTKNAILLVDYTNLLRRRGMAKTDALLRAGPVRLRPILMTAFSTIAGMIPVAIGLGSGAETRAPMGTAIVGGMLTSTVLTLVVDPGHVQPDGRRRVCGSAVRSSAAKKSATSEASRRRLACGRDQRRAAEQNLRPVS